MKRLLRESAWFVYGLIVRFKMQRLILSLFEHVIEEYGLDCKISRAKSDKHDPRTTILVLSFEQFRGDIEDIAKDGNIRVLRLAERWLTRLMFQFYPLEIGQADYRPYTDPVPSDATCLPQQEYRDFLRSVLPILLRRLGVDLVVGHHFHYIPDIDWGAVADELGFPYVVMHRENMLATPFARKFVHDRLSSLGKFPGSVVTVHNQVAKEVFANSGFIEEEKLKVLGCVRMDSFLTKAQMPECIESSNNKKKRKLTFFTFHPGGLTLEMEDIFPLYEEVYGAILRFCEKNPDIEVVFKIKPNFYLAWKRLFSKTFQGELDYFDEVPNLRITTTIPAHTLIEESQVVVALNSTTLLEAAVAGCQVIVPCYGPLNTLKYMDRVFYRDQLNLFEVPANIVEFSRLLEDCFDKPPVSEEVMEGRRLLFDEYVSRIDCMALARHIELFNTLSGETRATA